MASRSRTRSRNKWLPLSPPEKQALAAAGTAPLLQPWREHATLRALREQLQLCFDCWNLLDAPGGVDRRCHGWTDGLTRQRGWCPEVA